jgi:hypothetical protein
MAESVSEDGEDARNDVEAQSGGSDEYEYVTLTSAEVLEKLEEVCMWRCRCMCVHDVT